MVENPNELLRIPQMDNIIVVEEKTPTMAQQLSGSLNAPLRYDEEGLLGHRVLQRTVHYEGN